MRSRSSRSSVRSSRVMRPVRRCVSSSSWKSVSARGSNPGCARAGAGAGSPASRLAPDAVPAAARVGGGGAVRRWTTGVGGAGGAGSGRGAGAGTGTDAGFGRGDACPDGTGGAAGRTGAGSARRCTAGAGGAEGMGVGMGMDEGMSAGRGEGEGVGGRPDVGYGRATGRPTAAPGAVRRNGTGALTARRCTGAGDAGSPPVTETDAEAGCAGWCCPAVAGGRTVGGRAPAGALGAVSCGSGAGRCVGVPVPVLMPWVDADGAEDNGSSAVPDVPVLRCTTGGVNGGSAEETASGPAPAREEPPRDATGMPLEAFSGAAWAGRAERGAPSAGRADAGREGCAVASTGRAARCTGAPRGVARRGGGSGSLRTTGLPAAGADAAAGDVSRGGGVAGGVGDAAVGPSGVAGCGRPVGRLVGAPRPARRREAGAPEAAR